MLKIGDFSKLSRVSIRMLRHYDEIGLLHPVKNDPETGCRYYNENQLPVAGRIRALKDMGFALAAIGQILDRYGDKALVERHLPGLLRADGRHYGLRRGLGPGQRL